MSEQTTPDSAESTELEAVSERTLMRAIQITRYGGPDELVDVSVSMPSLPAGCVLIRVAGTSVNPVDTLARRGLLRIATGFRMPLGTGMDYSGEIAEVAPDVTTSVVGDQVWGFLGVPHSETAAAAEFVVARVGTFAHAPLEIDPVRAAAIPLAGATALVALKDHLRLAEGERLLVRGGAGGVGTSAIQLAKAMGAHVTALVSSRDLAFARSLGADAALDYRTHGPQQLGTFDAILDVKGTSLFSFQRLLSAHGRMVSTAAGGYVYAVASAIFGPRRIRAFGVRPSEDVLSILAEYVERGQLRPVIDTVYPLARIADAHRALEAGGTRGKQVVSIP